MRLVAALMVPVLLSGCFEWRFDAGLDDAHYQVSPWWRDASAYAALTPGNAPGGFRVERVVFSESVETVHVGGGESLPWALPFDDSGLRAAWGEGAQLRLVRWIQHDGAGRPAIWLQLDTESVMAWTSGAELTDPVHWFLANVTDLEPGDRQDFARDLLGAGRGHAMAGPHGVMVPGTHHVKSFLGPHRVSALFGELGGLGGFTARPRGTPTGLLPHEGQITLAAQGYEFHVATAAKRVWRGDFSDTDLFWVTPDDSVAYVHWGARRQSDAQAADRLAEAWEDLGRPAPATDGWVFVKEDVSGGPGD